MSSEPSQSLHDLLYPGVNLARADMLNPGPGRKPDISIWEIATIFFSILTRTDSNSFRAQKYNTPIRRVGEILNDWTNRVSHLQGDTGHWSSTVSALTLASLIRKLTDSTYHTESRKRTHGRRHTSPPKAVHYWICPKACLECRLRRSS